MIAYLAGLLLIAWLPSFTYLVWLFCIAPLFCFIKLRKPLLCFSLGVLVASSYGVWQLHHRLPFSYHNERVVLTGRITEMAQTSAEVLRIGLDVDVVESPEPPLQRLRHVRISLYQPDETLLLGVGDHITALVQVQSPFFSHNPAAYDLERHFLQSGWDARGVIREIMDIEAHAHSFAVRERVRHWLESHMMTQEYSWMLTAIILGDRDAMNDEHWDILRETGTAHLLVVSGLHIAVMSGAGLLLGRCLLFLCILLGVPSKRVRLLPLLFAAVFASVYAGLSGFNLPVQRAWIMVMVFILGQGLLFKVTGWMRLRWAMLITLTFQPLAVLQAGAWMSFGAVMVLLFMSSIYRGYAQQNWFKNLLIAQGFLFVGLLPILAIAFQHFGVIAPAVNLIAVPIFSLFIMLLPVLLLLALVGLTVVWDGIDLFLQGFWLGLSALSQVSWAAFAIAEPTRWVVMLAMPLIVSLMLPLSWRVKGIGLVLFLPFIWPWQSRLDKPHFEAVVFDVGQGLAVLINTRHHTVLYDTGPGYRSGGSAWNFAVAPWFRQRQQTYLNHLIVSHADLDHAGGLPDLDASLQVGVRHSGSPALIKQGYSSCHLNQTWRYDGVVFRFLSAGDWLNDQSSENDHSCVLEVRNQQCVLLIPGDIGHEMEYNLIREASLNKATWLIAGHHGSKHSSSAAWAAVIDPDAVIFTAGLANRYGHPHQEVIDVFTQQGAALINTSKQGAVLLSTNSETCRIKTLRAHKKRYWTNG